MQKGLQLQGSFAPNPHQGFCPWWTPAGGWAQDLLYRLALRSRHGIQLNRVQFKIDSYKQPCPTSIWHPPLGWPRRNFAKIFGTRKIVRRCLRDHMFSRFDTIPAYDRQIRSDEHTTTAIYRASIASCGKNKKKRHWRVLLGTIMYALSF